ncbi:MAG: TRAP transporter large permease subunit [Xanthomonadales bacterium]|nr:TRAP transporter large permease subunit [Xanthomonadales bacterium]
MMLLLLLLLLALLLALGVPVAFALAGAALASALLGAALGVFDLGVLAAFPNRLFGIMGNETLLAVPLFVFMGVMLERSRIAEELLVSMARLFGGLRGGLALSVLAVGTLMAASTGIVGATVVTMGLISLPAMLARGYDPRLAAGTVAAAGTLGQIIPPSIILVLLGDQLASAYQQAQLARGVFSPETVSIGDLFAGALLPGLLLVLLYALYLGAVGWLAPHRAPAEPERPGLGAWLAALRLALVPLALILAVLGSILAGLATPTEAAAVGAVGAGLFAALRRSLSLAVLRAVGEETVLVSAMVFAILIGATLVQPGLPRPRRGRGGGRAAPRPAGRRRRGPDRGDAAHVPARLRARLHRDRLRGGADRRPGTAGDGDRPGVARGADGDESPDLLPHPALRLRALLPARGGPLRTAHRRDLARGGTLRRAAAPRPRPAARLPGARHLAPRLAALKQDAPLEALLSSRSAFGPGRVRMNASVLSLLLLTLAAAAADARELPRERGTRAAPAETQVILDFDRLFAVGPAGLVVLDLATGHYELETAAGRRFAGTLPELPAEKSTRGIPSTVWVNRVTAASSPGAALPNCRTEAQALIQAVSQAAATCAAAGGNAEACRRAFEPVRQAIVTFLQCLRPRG